MHCTRLPCDQPLPLATPPRTAPPAEHGAVRIGLALLALLAVLTALPGVAVAQNAPDADAAVRASDRAPLGALLAVGLSGGADGAHVFAGGHLAPGGDRYGAVLRGFYGRGNDYSSVLVGGGPSVRFPVRGEVEALVFVGWGLYRESLAEGAPRSGAGETRSSHGPQGGVTFLVPTGPVRLGLGLTAWGGSHRSGAMEADIPARGVRFFVGVTR